MILVLICLGIIAFVLLLFFLFLTSSIKLNIQQLHLSNMDNSSGKLKYKIDAKLLLYLFGKIKVLSIPITNKTFEKFHLKKHLKEINYKKLEKEVVLDRKELLDALKKIEIKWEELQLKVQLGTEWIGLTSLGVFFITLILSFGFPHLIKDFAQDKHRYEVLPIYKNKNILIIDFHCIIYVKMVHIIYTLYILLIKKRRVDFNERTSNRRAYDYSYE